MSGPVRRNRPDEELESVRVRLLAMRDEDLRVRGEIVESGTLWDTYHGRMEKVHLENASRLEDIFEEQGWPDRSRFGEDGEDAAWTILMHSISRPDLLRRGRDLLSDAVRRGAARPDLLARVDDRIRTLEGRPQVYGTVLDWDGAGRLAPLPIEDEAAVDDRRAAAGLAPLADYVSRCRDLAAEEGSRPPKDPEAKENEYRHWLRRTGWR